ncbi:MAG: C_GCAxxG_C_C family protein [Spirochaetales bacterium]|jgi:C_GCAxxG_C_C family probable redox protein|nr:C_GCAxxG_C_C family protein [Spirochaetales bacterium]
MSCDKCDECLKYYNSGSTGGYNCAESTLYGLAKYLEIDSTLIPRIATPFGGGFGRNGMMCGSLAAGGMALGIVYGRDSIDEERAPAYDAVDRLLAKFRDNIGNINCLDITGLDLKKTQPTDDEKLRVHENICKPLVQKVCEWVIEDIEEHRK